MNQLLTSFSHHVTAHRKGIDDIVRLVNRSCGTLKFRHRPISHLVKLSRLESLPFTSIHALLAYDSPSSSPPTPTFPVYHYYLRPSSSTLDFHLFDLLSLSLCH